jgi:hypothetical protein
MISITAKAINALRVDAGSALDYAEIDRLLRLTPAPPSGASMVTSELDGSTSPSSDRNAPAPWVTWGQFVETRLLYLTSAVPFRRSTHCAAGGVPVRGKW